MTDEQKEKNKKTNKKILKIFGVIVILFIILIIIACNIETEDDEYSLKNGEFISATISEVYDDDVYRIVIKAKIDSKITTENYENIIDLIQNQGLDEYEEVQYWAVMDIDDDETKVISFTVDSSLIDKIANEEVSRYSIEDYLTDLWISSIMY